MVGKEAMSIQIEKPRIKFGKLVYGATINGQTFWVDTEEQINKLIKEMEGK